VSTSAGAFRTFGDAATGFATISNNLFYWTVSAVARFPSVNRLGTLGAAASIPSGDKNIYFSQAGTGNGNFFYNGAGTGSFTTYKTALSAYSLDQNSLCTNQFTGGTLTDAALGFSETTFRPIAAAAPGATTLTGIGNVYQDGRPYVAASATIGARLGT
jgi:hypothetical protein